MMLAIRACIILALALSSAARRSLRHVGREDPSWYHAMPRHAPQVQARAETSFKHLTHKTAPFAVDGSAIPEVDFDIGESYAGLLPISTNSSGNSSRELYFWYFPSKNANASDEITIWLNGGPGCSSLEGLLQENGPFLWQYGTYKPTPNSWTWVNLTNMLWVEQPVGTGFTQGAVEAKTEVDVAHEFMGFFKNFLDTFDMKNRKVYITGESYAGEYVPHIASEMLNAKDKEYYDVNGIMIYDPSINDPQVLTDLVNVPFVEHHKDLFAFNKTFMHDLHQRDKACGYAEYRQKYLTFPPTASPLPPAPAYPPASSSLNCYIDADIQYAASLINPCWDVYQIATTCPLLWDVLGFPGSFTYSPAGADIYFNRTDVKKAINAPVDVDWEECSAGNVYATSDGSSEEVNAGKWSGLTVLPGVIERVQRTIIGHGLLDMILIANGSLITIQNMTFNGAQGFQHPPTEDFFVPYHTDYNLGSLAGAGVFGKTHTERGLTWVEISLSGHMVPQYQPSAAYRMLEFLLGRVDSLSSTAPFTTSNDGLIAQQPGPVSD